MPPAAARGVIERLLTLPARRPWGTALALVAALLITLPGLAQLRVGVDLLGLQADMTGTPTPQAELLVVVPAGHATDALAATLAGVPGVARVHAPQMPPEGAFPPDLQQALRGLAWSAAGAEEWQAVRVSLATDPDPGTVERVRDAAGGGLVVGLPAIEHAYATGIRADQRRIGPLVLLVFAVLLALVLRRAWAVTLPLVAVVASAVATAGLMGWCGIRLGGPTTLVLPLVLVFGLSDSLHLVLRFGDAAGPPREALSEALSAVGPACLFTTVTTAVGFLALTLTRAPALRTFGWLSAAGLVVALVAGLAVPAVVIALSPATRPLPSRRRWAGDVVDRLLAPVYGRAVPVLAVLVPAIVVCAAVGRGVSTDFKWGDELPARHPVVAEHRRVDEALGGLYVLEVRAETGRAGGAADPDAFAELLWLHRHLLHQDVVGSVQSFAEAVRLTAALSGESPDTVLGTRLAHPQLRRKRFGTTFDAARLAAEAASPVPLLDDDLSAYLVWIRVHDDGARSWATLLDDLRRVDEDDLPHFGLHPSGMVVTGVRGLRHLVPDLARALALVVGFGFLAMAWLFRSVRVPTLTLVPLGATVAFLVAAASSLGIPLVYGNLFVLSTALGVGVDGMIHLVARLRQEARAGAAEPARTAMRTTGAVVVGTQLLVLAGLAVLMSSSFHSVMQSAALLIAALAVDLVATLVVFAGCSHLLVRE